MPPIGGRNTCMSGRVITSGNMPAVCSNRLRRNVVSVVPKRLAMPGRYHTGSIAILTTDRLPLALRSGGRDTVPMIGPRSRAVGAPQWIGKRCFAPGSGCEVSRIWSGRFDLFIEVDPQKLDGPPRRRADSPVFDCFNGARPG